MDIIAHERTTPLISYPTGKIKKKNMGVLVLAEIVSQFS